MNNSRAVLEGLTITDGVRDEDGAASDAAVVVRDSRVKIRGNRIEIGGKPYLIGYFEYTGDDFDADMASLETMYAPPKGTLPT